MTDEEWREFAAAAPDSLTVQFHNLGQSLEALLLAVCWTWLELLRLDKLLGVKRP